jgi:V/A-type H+-transporting ATPase subunit G/H
MELVQRIKDAEQQAKQIIEQAKKEAAALLEKTALEEEQMRRQLQQQRKERIAARVAEAERNAQSEVESLLNEGQKQIDALRQKAVGRMDECVRLVLSHLPQ